MPSYMQFEHRDRLCLLLQVQQAKIAKLLFLANFSAQLFLSYVMYVDMYLISPASHKIAEFKFLECCLMFTGVKQLGEC
jgi:hypothetical protein